MYLCNKSHVKQCNKISAIRNRNQPYMTVGTPTVFRDKKKEITKINKCIKANKTEPFFKCLNCSTFSVKTFDNLLNYCPVNLKQKTISHTPQQLINQIKFIHHKHTKTKIIHYHK